MRQWPQHRSTRHEEPHSSNARSRRLDRLGNSGNPRHLGTASAEGREAAEPEQGRITQATAAPEGAEMSTIDEIMGAIGRHGDDCIREGADLRKEPSLLDMTGGMP